MALQGSSSQPLDDASIATRAVSGVLPWSTVPEVVPHCTHAQLYILIDPTSREGNVSSRCNTSIKPHVGVLLA